MKLGGIIVSLLLFILVVTGIGGAFYGYYTNLQDNNITELIDPENINDTNRFDQFAEVQSTASEIYNTTMEAEAEQGEVVPFIKGGFQAFKLVGQSVGVAKNVTTTTQQVFHVPPIVFNVFIAILISFVALTILGIIFQRDTW